VKPTGRGLCKLKDVDPGRDAYDVAALWANQDGQGVCPTRVTLRWPKCPPGALGASQEAQAEVLAPWKTLRDAGVEDGHVLLADIAPAQGGSAEGACCLRVFALQGARLPLARAGPQRAGTRPRSSTCSKSWKLGCRS
jgi:hypothetical protein